MAITTTARVQAVLTRTDKTTKVVEYYKSDTREWLPDITHATHFEDDDASATKRCMETTDRTNRVNTFMYDTFAV